MVRRSAVIVLLSPTKTLNFDPAPASVLKIVPKGSSPAFESRADSLVARLQKKTVGGLGSLLGVSANLAKLNHGRFKTWKGAETKAAALAYSGPAFQGLDAASLDAESWKRLNERLFIISGLYGCVRGADRIKPYRLCMGTGGFPSKSESLYDYWRDTLTKRVISAVEPGGLVVNCASQEYSKAIDLDAVREAGVRVIDCEFRHQGRILSVYAKRARGLFVRHVAKTAKVDYGALKRFKLENYAFSGLGTKGKGKSAEESEDVLCFGRSSAPAKKVGSNTAGGTAKTAKRKVKAAGTKRVKRETSTKKPKRSRTARS